LTSGTTRASWGWRHSGCAARTRPDTG
jgi:hypothetical protein